MIGEEEDSLLRLLTRATNETDRGSGLKKTARAIWKGQLRGEQGQVKAWCFKKMQIGI